MKSSLTQAIGLIVFLSVSSSVYSQETDCRNYPRASQSKFEMTPKGPKIVVTVEKSVNFDDSDAVEIAREMAELEGANKITEFLQRDLKSEKTLKSAAMATASMSGDTKKASLDKAEQMIKTISQNAGAVLRGVVPLDECYTPGKFIRVTVGIKPETIQAAGILSGEISKSLNQNPTPSSNKAAADKSANGKSKDSKADTRKEMPLNKLEGYGGSGNIEKF
jgi:hypothetical protein